MPMLLICRKTELASRLSSTQDEKYCGAGVKTEVVFNVEHHKTLASKSIQKCKRGRTPPLPLGRPVFTAVLHGGITLCDRRGEPKNKKAKSSAVGL